MEKSFYASDGQMYTLISETNGKFYTRIYQSDNNDRVIERGCTWLGSIRTFSNSKGRLKKAELNIVFGFSWLIALLSFILYLLTAVLMILWQGLCWLWTLLAAFVLWLVSLFKFNRKPREPKQKEPRKPLNLKWLPWVLGIAAILLIIMFWPSPKDMTPQITSVNKVVEVLPRQTAIGRAYLDGEKNLLGCKYIFGKKAQKFLEGKENNLTTFESVSDASWVAQVDELLNPEIKAHLSDEQIAVITLIAMRNGEYGFPASKFLKLVNQGDFDAAAEEIWIFDKDGKPRQLNEEGKLYTWCLWALWKEHITFDELWSAEHFGYKSLNIKELYPNDNREDRVFKPEFKGIILGSKCDNTVVKGMSFFEGRDISTTAIDQIVMPEDNWWNKICRFVYPAKKWLRGIFGMA